MAAGTQGERRVSIPKPAEGEAGSGAAGLVAKAYLAAIVFLALFAGSLAYGHTVSPSLSEPIWALLVAATLTLPALVPWLVGRVLPRMRSIRIAQLEIALQDVQAPVQAVSLAAQAISSGLADNPALSEYAGRMTSLSSSITDAIKAVQGADNEVLLVDLATRWVVPNLYFLALMAAQKTRVRQIAFVDSRVGYERFVCASSPEEVITALEWQYPELSEAARAARFDQHPRSTEPGAGADFFQHLGLIYGRTPPANTERVTALTPEALLWILGGAAHRDIVQWTDPPEERVYRAVLASDSPFVAALKGTQLQFLVSRERVAMSVARAALRQP
jgi:hypothetical protein